ncbi:MAG TPA: purine-nucleoside phosphorylase, partial [Candidatus Alectryocaccobium stercorigallinarum]|nr:purine-nucleoside phosphorylase [Candidatus Alectryocaccobium stercorigallinarum]
FPGDPLRAKYIAETYFEDPVLFNDVRNMLGYTGTYKGKKISVMGSGMGIPSATLYAHELYTFFDVEAIVRVGSAGALLDDMHVKDLVIAMGACTNSNFAHQYGWAGTLAPTADFDMLYDAVNISKERGAHIRVGNVFTTDMFYNANPDVPKKARDLGMLCVEMETAGLYLEAKACKKKAISLLSISDHMFRQEYLSAEEIRESFNEMMEISLETAWRAID